MPAVGASVVEVAGLHRSYGATVALDGVDLRVGAGEMVGLLGPNGAGKTTLLKILVGLRRPSAGTVEVLGGSPGSPSVRSRIGMTPQETGLPEALKVGETVDFVARHFPQPEDGGALLERFGLADLAARQTGGLSGGQQRRLAVALAFVGRPELVFLDEPTTGLDVESRRALWDGIRDFHASGGTVLLTSHYLEEVEALAERVVVIGGGRVLADDTVDAVKRLVGLKDVWVRLPGGRLPEGVGPVARAEARGDRLHLVTPDADALVRALVASGASFHDLEIRAASLEQAFLALTGAQS